MDLKKDSWVGGVFDAEGANITLDTEVELEIGELVDELFAD